MNKSPNIKKESDQVEEVLGFGNYSTRKSYYPELQKSIEELKESEAKYKSFLETSPDAIVVTDLNGIVTYANPKFEQMHGLDNAEEWNGKPALELIHEQERQKAKETLQHIINHGLIENLEFNLLKKDGTIFPAEISGNVIKDLNGNPQSLLLISRDISDRKQVEVALKSLSSSYANLKGRDFFEAISKHISVSMKLDYVYVGKLIADDMIEVVGGFALGKKMGDLTYHLENTPCRNIINQELCLLPSDIQKSFPQDQLLVDLNIEGYIGSPLINYNGESIGILVGLSIRPIKNIELIEQYFKIFLDRIIAEIAKSEAEEAFRLGEERFKLAMNASDDGLYDWNLVTNEIYYSPGWKKMLGYSDEEIPNNFTVWEQLTRPDHVEKSWEILKEHLDGKRDRYEMEFKMKHKDGHWVDVLSRAEAIFDETGKPIRVIGTHVNITGRKNAETALLESEKRYRTVSELTSDLAYSYLVDQKKELKIEWIAGAFINLTGYNRKELQEKGGWETTIIEEDWPITISHLNELLNNKSSTVEYRIKTKEKKTIWVRDYARPIWNENKKRVIRIEGAIQNINERKLADEELFESRIMLNDVLNSIPVRVFWKNLKGVYLGCNKLFAEDAGKSVPEDIIGCDDYEMSWVNEADQYRSDDQAVIQDGVPRLNYLESQTSPNGEQIWLKTSKIPLRNRGGEIYGILGTYEDITERKNAEQALVDSQKRFETLFNDSPVPLWEEDYTEVYKFIEELKKSGIVDFGEYFDAHSEDLNKCSQLIKIENVNLAAIKLHEADSKEDLLGNLDKIFTHESYTIFKEEVITLAEGRMEFISEGEVKTLKGNPRYVYIEFKVDMSENNVYKAIIATLDITERKLVEQALKESEERFKFIFENASTPIWVEDFSLIKKRFDELKKEGVDRFGDYFDENPDEVEKLAALVKVVDVNENSVKFFKASDKKSLITFLPSYFTEESLTVFKDELVALAEGKDKFEGIIPIKTQWGEVIQFILSLSVPNNYKDSLEKVLVTFLDVTERVNVEKALTESEGKYRSLIENSNDAIYLLFNRKFEMINNKFNEMFGYTFDEVLRDRFDFSNLVSDESKSIIEERIKKTRAGEKLDPKYEFVAVTKNGQKIDCEVITTYINYKDGIATQGVIRDVTERNKMTGELITAKELAERSDKLKSEFLAQMSHEIRTPLNVMMSYTTLLKEDMALEADEEQTEIFNSISNAGSRIIRTIDLILNASELQAGAYNLITKKVDLFQDVIMNVYYDLKSLLDSKNVEFSVKRSVSNSFVKCDEYSVYQSIMNLVDNAIKYTEEGFIEIRLVSNKNNQLQIEIEDTGIGISDEYMNNLFDAFSQEETGYSRRFEGTGLGLSLVKNYCDLNNIQIDLKSEKNKGTTFTLTFPS